MMEEHTIALWHRDFVTIERIVAKVNADIRVTMWKGQGCHIPTRRLKENVVLSHTVKSGCCKGCGHQEVN